MVKKEKKGTAEFVLTMLHTAICAIIEKYDIELNSKRKRVESILKELNDLQSSYGELKGIQAIVEKLIEKEL